MDQHDVLLCFISPLNFTHKKIISVFFFYSVNPFLKFYHLFILRISVMSAPIFLLLLQKAIKKIESILIQEKIET